MVDTESVAQLGGLSHSFSLRARRVQGTSVVLAAVSAFSAWKPPTDFGASLTQARFETRSGFTSEFRDTLDGRHSANVLDAFNGSRATLSRALSEPHVVPWIKQRGRPAVNLGDDDEVEAEWWDEDKVLTLYSSQNSVEFIKSWGPLSARESDEGFIPLDDEGHALSKLLAWLMC